MSGKSRKTRYSYVLIAGGRSFADRLWMERQFVAMLQRAEKTKSTLRVLHGGARGADSLAGEVASEIGIEVGVMLPDWDRYGRAAGYRRNERMARYMAAKKDEGHEVAVVLFPGGKGTAHMGDIARAMGLPVYQPVSARRPQAA